MKDFNYLSYEYSESLVLMHKKSRIDHVSATSLPFWINEICVEYGSTSQGRVQAYRRRMKQTMYIPILVSTEPLLFLIPTGSARDPETLWISFTEITHYLKQKSSTLVYFKDGQVLDCPRRMALQIENAALYLSRIQDQKEQPCITAAPGKSARFVSWSPCQPNA